MRVIRPILVGCAYAAASSFFAFLFGCGGSHGTDYFGRLPLAPFSLSRGGLDTGSVLLLGIALWGLILALASFERRSTGILAGLLLAAHYVGLFVLLFDYPERIRSSLAAILAAPYVIGQLGLWSWFAWRFERRARMTRR